MAEILIPIKEFPRCCGCCPCFHAESPMYCQADKTIRMTAPYGKRMEDCPIKEVPTHGRLVDADRLIGILSLITKKDVVYTLGSIEELIDKAQTIIEAST